MVVWTLILVVGWAVFFGYLSKHFDGADLQRKKVVSLEKVLHKKNREIAKLESRFSEYKDAMVASGIKIDSQTSWGDSKRNIASVISDPEFKKFEIWPSGQISFDHAKKVFISGDYSQSAELFEEFLQKYPDNPFLPNAMYFLSESYSALDNKDGTLRSLNLLISHFPETESACLGLIRLAKLFEKDERLEEAQGIYRMAVPLYPKSDCAKLAQSNLGSLNL